MVFRLDDDLRREVKLDGVGRVYTRDPELSGRPRLGWARAGDRVVPVHTVALALRLGERVQHHAGSQVGRGAREANWDAKESRIRHLACAPCDRVVVLRGRYGDGEGAVSAA